MIATLVAAASPALLLPSTPTPPQTLAACSRPRVAAAWMINMQEEAAAGEPAEAGVEAVEEGDADPKAAVKEEKKELRDKITALEKQLVDARGTLLAEQEAVKDAGEGGYLLLAANFERFRQKSRAELANQEAVGRAKAAGYLMAFADAFDELQAGAADSTEAEVKIHSYYGGIHKQFCTLLEQWQVEAVEPAVGDSFDFSKHVTVERLESDEPANKILETRTKGYTMAGTVVRSAECVVSSGPAKSAEAEDDKEDGAVGADEDAAEAATDEEPAE